MAEFESPVVELFLKSLQLASLQLQQRQTCKACNRPMQFLEGNLRLFGSDSRWPISLPYCAACDL